MKVKEVMHTGAEWCSADTPLSEIAKLMSEKDIGAVPIGENDRLLGMVTDRDIACRAVAQGKDCNTLTAREVLSDGIQYCTEEEDLQEVVKRMQGKQIRRMPVLNDSKRLVGMLSLGDVSHAAPGQLTGEFAAAVSAHH